MYCKTDNIGVSFISAFIHDLHTIQRILHQAIEVIWHVSVHYENTKVTFNRTSAEKSLSFDFFSVIKQGMKFKKNNASEIF